MVYYLSLLPIYFVMNCIILKETSVKSSTGQKTRRGRLGQSFHWICRSIPTVACLRRSFSFLPFLLPQFFCYLPLSLWSLVSMQYALCSVELMFLTDLSGRHLGCRRECLREGVGISIHCIFSQHCDDTDCLNHSMPFIFFFLHPFI